jgi:hypothetical protein
MEMDELPYQSKMSNYKSYKKEEKDSKMATCQIDEKYEIKNVARKMRRILKWQLAVLMKNIQLQMLQERGEGF